VMRVRTISLDRHCPRYLCRRTRVIPATKVTPRSQHPPSPDRDLTHPRPSGGQPGNITLRKHTNLTLPHPAKTIVVIAMNPGPAATPSEPRPQRKSLNKTPVKMRLKPRNRTASAKTRDKDRACRESGGKESRGPIGYSKKSRCKTRAANHQALVDNITTEPVAEAQRAADAGGY